jgi:hypothetical protein
MSKPNKHDAKRIHVAKEKGRKLVLRMKSLGQLSCDEVVVLADDLAAMLAEYPDVYPKPPVSVELLRRYAQELKEADELARQAADEHKEVSRKLDDALHVLSALRGDKAEKPS